MGIFFVPVFSHSEKWGLFFAAVDLVSKFAIAFGGLKNGVLSSAFNLYTAV